MLSSLPLLSSASLPYSPPLSTVWYNIFALSSFILLGGNAFLKHACPKAKGSNPTTGLTLLWAHNPFRGNINSWQVLQQEARWTIPKRWSGKCIFCMLTIPKNFSSVVRIPNCSSNVVWITKGLLLCIWSAWCSYQPKQVLLNFVAMKSSRHKNEISCTPYCAYSKKLFCL